jgi:hypothetical protein
MFEVLELQTDISLVVLKVQDSGSFFVGRFSGRARFVTVSGLALERGALQPSRPPVNFDFHIA